MYDSQHYLIITLIEFEQSKYNIHITHIQANLLETRKQLLGQRN